MNRGSRRWYHAGGSAPGSPPAPPVSDPPCAEGPTGVAWRGEKRCRYGRRPPRLGRNEERRWRRRRRSGAVSIPRRRSGRGERCDAARGVAPYRHDRGGESGDLRHRSLGGAGARGGALDRGHASALAPRRGPPARGSGALPPPPAPGPRPPRGAAPRRVDGTGAGGGDHGMPPRGVPIPRFLTSPSASPDRNRTVVTAERSGLGCWGRDSTRPAPNRDVAVWERAR